MVVVVVAVQFKTFQSVPSNGKLPSQPLFVDWIGWLVTQATTECRLPVDIPQLSRQPIHCLQRETFQATSSVANPSRTTGLRRRRRRRPDYNALLACCLRHQTARRGSRWFQFGDQPEHHDDNNNNNNAKRRLNDVLEQKTWRCCRKAAAAKSMTNNSSKQLTWIPGKLLSMLCFVSTLATFIHLPSWPSTNDKPSWKSKNNDSSGVSALPI